MPTNLVDQFVEESLGMIRKLDDRVRALEIAFEAAKVKIAFLAAGAGIVGAAVAKFVLDRVMTP